MLESELEKWCARHATAAGWLTYKFSSPSNRGVPDRVFIRAGVVWWVEFKRPGGKPTALQVHTIGKFKAHGAHVDVIDSKGLFAARLSELGNHAPV